jgi:AcrR family transcriptional regulator
MPLFRWFANITMAYCVGRGRTVLFASMSGGYASGRARRLPRGRHGLLPGAVVEHQRQRLIRAVPVVVSDKGFAAATVEDLAAEAGVSRKTFYENFHDKRDCFMVSYRQYAQELIAVVGSAAAVGGDWQERTRFALAAMLRYFSQQPQVARLAVIEVMAAGPEALAERDAAIANLAALLGEEPLVAAPNPAPRLLLETIAGSISQLLYGHVLADRADELEQLLPMIMYIVLVALHGPVGAAAKAGLIASEQEDG